jgi:hypothetical protein
MIKPTTVPISTSILHTAGVASERPLYRCSIDAAAPALDAYGVKGPNRVR